MNLSANFGGDEIMEISGNCVTRDKQARINGLFRINFHGYMLLMEIIQEEYIHIREGLSLGIFY
jgi:hypothetical protein